MTPEQDEAFHLIDEAANLYIEKNDGLPAVVWISHELRDLFPGREKMVIGGYHCEIDETLQGVSAYCREPRVD